jgi:gliding motility-associated-like protein
MNKTLSALLCAILVAFSSLQAQPSISCPGVFAGNDTVVPDTGCFQLTATTVAGFTPTNYTVQQIPYSPWPTNGPNQISITTDDIWSGIINMPFNFCYYGNNYTQCIIGSNGVLSFQSALAGGGCPWQINTGIPSPPNFGNPPENAIYFPWHDIDPSINQPGQPRSINWGLYGVAPCRVLVVSIVNIPLFGGSCNQNVSLNATQQVVLYETTNIIETYIANKQTCASWNGGAAIHGITNIGGTQAVVVPGRNFPTQWTATNDAWRFVPAGPSNNSVQWFQVGNPVPISSSPTATVCPAGCGDQYYAVATYTNCNLTATTVSDTISITVANSGASINTNSTNVTCNGFDNGLATTTATGVFGPFDLVWNTGDTTTTIDSLAPGTYTVVGVDAGGCVVRDTIVITEPPVLLANPSGTNVPCFGTSTGSVTSSPTGGTPNYSYLWSGGLGTGQTVNNIPAGSYTVIAIDNNGCRDTAAVTISQPTAVVAAATMSPVLCNGGSTGVLTGVAGGGTIGAGYTYSWQPNNLTGPVVAGVPAGPYVLTVTDGNGCTDTAHVTVTQPSALSIATTFSNASCFGVNNGSATALASGGRPGYTYAWSNGASGGAITGLAPGNYTVTATDLNACQIVTNVTIGTAAPLVGTTFSTNETCVGFCDGSVSVVASGGTPPYTYVWGLPGAPTTPTVQGVCSGTYTVTITDANTCQATANVTVVANPSPSADAGTDASFCAGSGGVQLTGSASGGGGAPYFYTWTCGTPPCGLSCINCANPIANPTDTTTYYLLVTDQNGCGSALDSVQVNVIPLPVVNAGPDASICGVPAPCTVLTPSILAGQGPFQYNWSPGNGLNDSTIANPCARPDTSTIYTLVVTDLATGCASAFSTTDTLSTVLITSSPVPIADGGPDRIICDGDTTLLTGNGFGAGPQYDFQWSPTTGLSDPNIINPLASPPTTTDYFLTVWSNGCPSIADTITVFVAEIPTVDAGQNRDICVTDSTLLDGYAVVSNQIIPDSIVSYTWSPSAGLSGSTTEDVMASPAATGYYTFGVTTAYGCYNEDSVLVTINPSPVLDAGPTISVCQGTGPFNLDGTIGWYNNVQPGDLQNIIIEWQPAGQIVGPNNVEDIQIAPTGTMYYYFTVTYNTCTTTDSVLVIVLNEVIATATADTNIICGGDSVLLTATGGIGGGSFSWSPTDGLSDPSSATPLAAPDTTTTYTVTINESGCIGSASVTVNVIPTPISSFVNSFTEGCPPLAVSFTSVTQNGILLTWNFGDSTPVSNQSQPMHTYDEPGTYQVTLTATGEGGCQHISDSVTITVHDTISAQFTSDPGFPTELTIPAAVNFTNLTPGSTNWQWSFGDGTGSTLENPSHQYTAPGTYYVSLHLTNQFGCWSEILHGPFVVAIPELFIPNVFSPNGDGVNDQFMIEYTGDQPVTIQIFDRWGTQIYSTNNKVDGWDGKTATGTDVTDGVYYYNVTIGGREFANNVTLMR